jgi:preprotein translocase subunit SecG
MISERMFQLSLPITILQLLSAVTIIVIVLLQSGKSAGLSGAIAGAADTFLSKNKSKSLDSKLARLTKWISIAFVVLTLLLNIIGPKQ